MNNLKEKLTRAFADMRKKGLVARQNFTCCNSCGNCKIADLAEKRIKRGEKVVGCCFYHAQDNMSRKTGQNFYLSYGEVDIKDMGKVGATTQEVGKIVCKSLESFGIEYEWDGTPYTRIMVLNR